MKYSVIGLILLSFFIGPGAFAKSVNIVEMGAKPDGQTICTDILQNAIDKISERGGGTVTIPAGKFVCGSIVLKNGVQLELQKGALLLGSTSLGDYLSIQPKFVALRTGQATKQLIYAENQSDISIVGEGTIDGRGEAFSWELPNDDPGVTRPHLIQLINCKNVKIEGIQMRNSGGWMQHYLACENLQIKGITVYNHCNKNNDGIDIDGCKNVIVSNCIVDSDDDGICLKSTSPAMCIDVVVSNCVVKSHCNALKMGTETTGGFKNVSFSNCVISPSADSTVIYGTRNGTSAIALEMVDGGILDGVNINNITISETGTPIFIRLGNRNRKYTPTAPEPGRGILRNVNISNVVATTSSKITSSITGIPGSYIENVSLNNISITNLSDGTREDAVISVPEKEGSYPDAHMFGKILPASGFFLRHVKNISFNNVQLHLKGANLRPAYILHDVHDALINHPVIYSYETIDAVVKDKTSSNIKVIE